MVKALDRRNRIRFARFSSESAVEYLRALSSSQVAAGMHLVAVDGVIESEGNAAVAVLTLLPSPLRWIGVLARKSPTVGGFMRACYSLVAENRGRLARFVPDTRGPDDS